MHLQLERWASPAFPLLLVTDEEGALRALEFAENEDRLRRLLHSHYGDFTLHDGPAPEGLKKALSAYFRGEIGALDQVRTATNGTPFQREVWRALREIPGGTTISYGQLAARVGRPAASRAVGAANGANPIPIVVPCHRVIGANGSLTGFGSGLPLKKWLLEHESRFASVAAGASLL
ncbi:MAG TPA: methylated-DNA--[protein]-cysteine S-methyltransferase [Chthoniobacter sp.]|nr:methylated-DNA--[protein]-cysteine S-methyltransferase [Chthoniobacter sp.]